MKHLISDDEAIKILELSGASAETVSRYSMQLGAVLARKLKLKSDDDVVMVSSVAGQRTGKAAVDVDLKDAIIDGGVMVSQGNVRIQMPVKAARKIALDILAACEAAITDIALIELLTKHRGLDIREAGRALLDLREIRQRSRDGVVEH